MKTKKLLFVTSISLLFSCVDEVQVFEASQSQSLKQIVMEVSDFQPESTSRTLYQMADEVIQCTWSAHDTVGVFPNKGLQTAFPMTSGAGTKNATFDGGGWALKDGSKYAAYYPFVGDIYLNKFYVPFSYEGQTQTNDASIAHLGAYDYMVAMPTAPQYGSVQFKFKHFSALLQLKLTVPQPYTLNSVRLSVQEANCFAVKGSMNIMAKVPNLTSGTFSKEFTLKLKNITTTVANQEITLYFMLPPVDLSNKTLKAIVHTDRGIGEVDLESKNFQAGMLYALSGVIGNMKGTYMDGVVNLAEAGTMQQLLGNDYLNIASLKVVGPLNGDDVRCLRQMMGGHEFSESEKGKLVSLDLSEATIVRGGSCFYENSTNEHFYTSNNVLGYNMFNHCENLQRIVTPKKISSIGVNAFMNCTSLTSVFIPDGVTSLGNAAFYGCSSLTSVDIPESVISLGSSVFSHCTSLASVKLPEGLTQLSACLFDDCTSLTSVAIPESVTVIEPAVFEDCSSLVSVDISGAVTLLSNGLFRNCISLVSVNIGEGVTCIDDLAFMGCTSLVSIDIPHSVTSVGGIAFANCVSLTSVSVGKGIKVIESGAFDGCDALIDFYSHATTPPTIQTGSFSSFETYGSRTTLHVPSGCASKYKSSDWSKHFINIVENK